MDGVIPHVAARHYLGLCDALYGSGVVVFNPHVIVELFLAEDVDPDAKFSLTVIGAVNNWFENLDVSSEFAQENKKDILFLWDWCRNSADVEFLHYNTKPTLLQTYYFLTPNLRHFRWWIPSDYFPTVSVVTYTESFNTISEIWSEDDTLEIISLAKKGDNPVFVLGLFCGWVALQSEYDDYFTRDLPGVVSATSDALCRIAGEKDKNGFLLWNMPFEDLVGGLDDGWQESLLKSFNQLPQLEMKFRQNNDDLFMFSQEPRALQQANHARERMDRMLVYLCLALECDVPILHAMKVGWWQEENLKRLAGPY